jgi:S-formylglutathione hydrolase FrmB
VEVADAWAREHDGAAPVMVFVDENGAKGNDTECVNGPQGQAESYLTEVIPHYLEATLGIPDDPQRWVTVGFSEGGTCAVGLALEHPGTFGRFVDLAGDLAPDYGTTARSTLANLYGYDRTAEEAHEPLYLLAHGSYPQMVGWFGAGTADRDHLQVALQLAAAAAPAGVDVHEIITPGGHSWSYAGNAFARIYAPLVSALSGGAATGPPACASPGCTTFATQHPVRSPAPTWAPTRRGGKRQKDHPI